MKAAVKAARQQPTPAKLKAAYQALDRAAKTRIIHKNKAARLKSRLTKTKNPEIKPKTVVKKTKKVVKKRPTARKATRGK